MPKRVHILLIEDSPSDQALVEEILQDITSFSPSLTVCNRVKAACDFMEETLPDVILLDLSLPDSAGLETLQRIHQRAPYVPIIILTSLNGRETGIEAINQGAEDYLMKQELADGSVLERTISFAVERFKMRQDLYRTLAHLKRSNEKLEDFSYVVSHDLKSPLRNLRSLLDMYDRSVDHAPNRELIEMIDKSVYKLNDMLQGFTTFFLMENSDQPLEEIMIGPAVDNELQALEQLIQSSSAQISTDFAQATTLMFVPVLFQSIVQNMVTNAIKYRHPQRDPVLAITTEDQQDYVVMHFKDNGIGIDLERNGKRLFKLFNRFNKQAEGTGIGLYMVKSLLEARGGRIEVESEPGEGTHFKVYFAKVGMTVPTI